MKNRIKEELGNGKSTVGMFIGIPSFQWAEFLSQIDLDWILFDLEHGSYHFDSLPPLLSAAAGGRATPLVRIPSHDPNQAKLALDSGAQGIMFPQVNSREDAINIVRACKYPPEGIRGIGPRRASLYYSEFEEYVKTANREILVIAQIESREAVDNIDDILSVKGIDVAFIGPSDLSASMGYLYPGRQLPKDVLEAISTVLSATRKHGVIPGIWGGSVDRVNEVIRQGFKFISLCEDSEYMLRVKSDLAKIVRSP